MAAGLDKAGGAGGVVLVELVHGRDVLLRSGHIAQPPAVHGIGLGHAVHGEGALLHAGEGGDAHMLTPVVHQPLVDLVGNHHQVVLLDDGGQLLEHILLPARRRWVVGVTMTTARVLG